MSAYIGFCPPVAMNACPLTAIRPLSVIGKRMFASAAYRHLDDAPKVNAANGLGRGNLDVACGDWAAPCVAIGSRSHRARFAGGGTQVRDVARSEPKHCQHLIGDTRKSTNSAGRQATDLNSRTAQLEAVRAATN